MSVRKWRASAVALVGATLIGGCAADEGIILPDREPVGGELFARYVALGNSITAGFQSLGINDSTQREAYPFLLAQQAGARFNLPLLTRPGCPPPMNGPFSTTTIAGTPLGQAVCFFRASPTPDLVNNLAVPGANLLDAVDHTANSDAADTFNRLQTFILGGRSQAQAMVDADPTFVSIMLGSGDALGAALDGDASLLTPVSSFQESLDELVAAVNSTNAQAVLVIGAINSNVMPALQPGLFFWAVKQDPATAPLLPKPVSNDCAPVTALGQPNPLAANLISYTILFDATVPEISCQDDAPFVLPPAEQAQITAAVTEYNTLLAQAAEDNGWIYFDVSSLLTPALADPSLLRKCQGLATARTPDEIRTAILTTCPNPDPRVGFGRFISFDGIHPSAEAHRVLANALIDTLNQELGLDIPQLPSGQS
ncbi:MAG TPA: SGNH/GDSL hydrolase family protein [Longimicrobiaceae bacterium]